MHERPHQSACAPYPNELLHIFCLLDLPGSRSLVSRFSQRHHFACIVVEQHLLLMERSDLLLDSIRTRKPSERGLEHALLEASHTLIEQVAVQLHKRCLDFPCELLHPRRILLIARDFVDHANQRLRRHVEPSHGDNEPAQRRVQLDSAALGFLETSVRHVELHIFTGLCSANRIQKLRQQCQKRG